MYTDVSPSTSYLTPQVLVNYIDARTLCDVISDIGQRKYCSTDATGTSTLTNPTGLYADTVLAEISLSATGEFLAACAIANRYAPVDVAAFTGSNRALRDKIISGLVAAACIRRRPAKEKELTPLKDEAMGYLVALEQGTRIFALQEVMDAGNPEHLNDTTQNAWNRNGIVSQGDRFFGQSRNRFNDAWGS